MVSWSQFWIKLYLTKIFFTKVSEVLQMLLFTPDYGRETSFRTQIHVLFSTRKLSQVLQCHKKCLSRHQNNLKLWWVFSFFGSPSWLLWLSCKHPVMIALFSFWFAVLYFCIFSSVRKHNVNPLLFFELGLHICQQPVFYDSSVWSHIPHWSKGV